LRVLKFMRGVCGVALLVGSASISFATTASAQEVTDDGQDILTPPQKVAPIPTPQEETITPRKKKRTSLDAYAAQGLGIGQGGIRLYPTLEIDSILTSNVQKSATTKKLDLAIALKPSLSFASDWSRHNWTGSLSADLLRYKDSTDLSTLSGAAQTAFRLDIRRTTHADFTANYALSQAGPGNTSVPGNAKSPRVDQNFGVSAGLSHDFGGLEASVTTALARSLFDDVALVGGGTEVNSDRNYWAPSVKLRGELGSAGAVFRPYAELTYDPRFHDKTIDRNGQQRNSQGASLALGIAIDDGPIWTGDVALTDQLRSYADPALGTVNALGFAGRLTWRPTEITTVDMTSSLSLDETATANIAATKTWTVGVNLKQALRENIDLLAGTTMSFQNNGLTTDLTNTVNLGLNWQVNPNMGAGITYTGTWLSSGTAGASYDEQRLMTSIILKK
jgi:hypothetical protein